MDIPITIWCINLTKLSVLHFEPMLQSLIQIRDDERIDDEDCDSFQDNDAVVGCVVGQACSFPAVV